MIQVSLLIVENHFHPLLDTDGEEDTCRITAQSVPPIFYLVPSVIKRALTLVFKLILQNISLYIDISKIIILHDLGVIIPHTLRAHIHYKLVEERSAVVHNNPIRRDNFRGKSLSSTQMDIPLHSPQRRENEVENIELIRLELVRMPPLAKLQGLQSMTQCPIR